MKNFNVLLKKYALDEQSFSVEGIGKVEEVKTPGPQKGFVPSLPAIFNRRPDAVVDPFGKDQDDEAVDLFGKDPEDETVDLLDRDQDGDREATDLFDRDQDGKIVDPFAAFSTGLPNFFGESEPPFGRNTF